MANEIVVDIVTKLDKVDKSLQGLEKSTSEAFNKLSETATSVFEGGLTNQVLHLAKQFAPLALGVAAVGKTIEAVFDGEKIRAVSAQFDVLTERIGIASDKLRHDLMQATGGKIGDNEALLAANKAILQLGDNADAIPKTMEIARKAVEVFGGDIADVFENINQAIATGNTRTLRGLGIVIDSEEAYRKYARQIGGTAEILSQSSRQQAILNEVVKQFQGGLAHLDTSVNKATNSYHDFKVQVGELYDAMKLAADGTFGKTLSAVFSTLANDVRNAADSIKSHFVGPTEKAEIQSRLLTERIAKLNKEIEEFTNSKRVDVAPMIQQKRFEVSQLQSQLAEYNKTLQQTAATHKDVAEKAKSASPFNQQQVDNTRAAQAALVQINSQHAEFEMQHAKSLADFHQAYADKRNAILLENGAQQLELSRKFQAAGYTQDEADAQARIALEQTKNDQLRALDETANANSLRMKQIVQGGIINGLTSSFSQLGAALVKGKNGFEAFGKAVISALGAMAIQIGTLLVTIGLGFETLGPVLPVFGLSGSAAVAAGLGLIALGGALQAIGGDGGDTGGGVAAGGASGGGLTAGSSATELPKTGQEQKAAAVTVNVHGNVFDNKETGLQIANIIRDSFDTNAVVVA